MVRSFLNIASNCLNKVNMWKKLFAVLCWAMIVRGQDYQDDLDTWGERISARVAAQVRPLEGLGERISAQVQQSLRPMQVRNPFFDTSGVDLRTSEGLSDRFSAQPDLRPTEVRDRERFFETAVRDNKRSPIELNSRLSELDGLGDRISQKVHKDLEPVRAIPLNFKMRDGVGGTTIVNHRPSGIQFIVKNRKIFSCTEKVNQNTGECPGSLKPFEITESSPRSDWCFLRSYSLINNQICMSVGSVSITTINGHVTCRGADNKPTILIHLDEYKNMCSSISETAEYRYIPNESDPDHVAIPNENKYVKCENNERNLCIFNERNGLLDTYASGGNNGFVIRNGGGINVIYS